MKRTHGMSMQKQGVYRVWGNMIQRCTNPNLDRYKDYGGRGITVCERWRNSFEAFYADVGDRPEGMFLDRINNDGNYEPNNVRWVTRAQSNLNTRRCKFVTVNSEAKPINEWLRIYGIAYCTYKQRIKNGWAMEAAVSTPPDQSRIKKTLRKE